MTGKNRGNPCFRCIDLLFFPNKITTSLCRFLLDLETCCVGGGNVDIINPLKSETSKQGTPRFSKLHNCFLYFSLFNPRVFVFCISFLAKRIPQCDDSPKLGGYKFWTALVSLGGKDLDQPVRSSWPMTPWPFRRAYRTQGLKDDEVVVSNIFCFHPYMGKIPILKSKDH